VVLGHVVAEVPGQGLGQLTWQRGDCGSQSVGDGVGLVVAVGQPDQEQVAGRAFDQRGDRALIRARAARYRHGPPLRATSRLIVDGARPKPAAIDRTEQPDAKPREISSRSTIVNRPTARHLGTGLIPPHRTRYARTVPVDRPSSAQSASQPCPAATSTRSDQPPPASTTDNPDPPQPPRHPIKEVLRRPLETAGMSGRFHKPSAHDGAGDSGQPAPHSE
jgi:hypothetical protein